MLGTPRKMPRIAAGHSTKTNLGGNSPNLEINPFAGRKSNPRSSRKPFEHKRRTPLKSVFWK
jgi:hypothetical protein